jgi:hypothetical protein
LFRLWHGSVVVGAAFLAVLLLASTGTQGLGVEFFKSVSTDEPTDDTTPSDVAPDNSVTVDDIPTPSGVDPVDDVPQIDPSSGIRLISVDPPWVRAIMTTKSSYFMCNVEFQPKITVSVPPSSTVYVYWTLEEAAKAIRDGLLGGVQGSGQIDIVAPKASFPVTAGTVRGAHYVVIAKADNRIYTKSIFYWGFCPPSLGAGGIINQLAPPAIAKPSETLLVTFRSSNEELWYPNKGGTQAYSGTGQTGDAKWKEWMSWMIGNVQPYGKSLHEHEYQWAGQVMTPSVYGFDFNGEINFYIPDKGTDTSMYRIYLDNPFDLSADWPSGIAYPLPTTDPNGDLHWYRTSLDSSWQMFTPYLDGGGTFTSGAPPFGYSVVKQNTGGTEVSIQTSKTLGTTYIFKRYSVPRWLFDPNDMKVNTKTVSSFELTSVKEYDVDSDKQADIAYREGWASNLGSYSRTGGDTPLDLETLKSRYTPIAANPYILSGSPILFISKARAGTNLIIDLPYIHDDGEWHAYKHTSKKSESETKGERNCVKYECSKWETDSAGKKFCAGWNYHCVKWGIPSGPTTELLSFVRLSSDTIFFGEPTFLESYRLVLGVGLATVSVGSSMMFIHDAWIVVLLGALIIGVWDLKFRREEENVG